ncbi:hypothetical protein K2W90_06725 [Candidatus Babeliales bacterium]|nr:hypothetical protein [Candidatus Babeliales bacterium]
MIQRNILIIHWAWLSTPVKSAQVQALQAVVRKPVIYHFFKHDKPDREQAFLMWHKHDLGHNVKHLVGGWLVCVQEERLVDHAVRLETVSFSLYNQEVYLSFTQALFKKDDSILKKWQLTESLLKTLRDAGIDIRAISLLVDHQPMSDEHLDFSQSWPLEGFVK